MLKGVGCGIYQDALAMRPQMEMLQLLERRECCSVQRGGLSKELLQPAKCAHLLQSPSALQYGREACSKPWLPLAARLVLLSQMR